ncbi:MULTISPECIES: 2-amino-4-hydroxy-6-hydroxymethyldihydropteridine diphosphokinase [Mesorhizobium]|uniref:2-amino-4-hydroxy-6-hydroxymethyldihydropteridine pyrophosphokinase n=1 Tax=Mesorhizobium denitrificans TaxID=2294114 RepID=A0A371XBQ9_9HYPH|nr:MULTISPECIES: 2-amino-4-hydroxy-6-hydroxymethyldihydropteridine diphosphokinase [Mesorhizobium]RFC66631.1 2-amino-4-hydroxy-6-hydroxymethyldihydropteridine diphosphokinase [Mesorhizobium denitrificans]
MIQIAYIGLGGNLGDPKAAMGQALRTMDSDARSAIGKVSSIYRTPPWGKTDQPDFLNAAAEIRTTRSPRELLELCLATEKTLKRVRAERWGPRTIDIDILKYGSDTINEEGLEIPHPRMLDRPFVLLPLAEIAPNIDLSGENASTRAARADQTGIEKQPDDAAWWRKA